MMPDAWYLVRPEPFGGLVFDADDGTMLELDHEGFAVARRLLSGWGIWLTPAQRAFAAQLRRLLRYDRRRPVRWIPSDGWGAEAPVPTLSAPTLLDVQITTACHTGCPHCYASAVRHGMHMSWEDLCRVVREAADCGVCQIAIGGGEPLLHPRLPDLLLACRDAGIVPNLTTAGNAFTPALLAVIRRTCGAIGLSLEDVGERFASWRRFGFAAFRTAIAEAQDAGIRVVLQVTLSSANFPHLDDIVSFCAEQRGLYGVLFLAYKAVGRGRHAARHLSALPPDAVAQGLARAYRTLAPLTRVGYDCCLTPAIASVEAGEALTDAYHLEGCSATRGSLGIGPDLSVMPCTFTSSLPLGSLRTQSLREIWRGLASTLFRERLASHSRERPACRACHLRDRCLGGCPVMPLVNCHRHHLGAPPSATAPSHPQRPLPVRMASA